jgi:hypothetical protein
MHRTTSLDTHAKAAKHGIKQVIEKASIIVMNHNFMSTSDPDVNGISTAQVMKTFPKQSRLAIASMKAQPARVEQLLQKGIPFEEVLPAQLLSSLWKLSRPTTLRTMCVGAPSLL